MSFPAFRHGEKKDDTTSDPTVTIPVPRKDFLVPFALGAAALGGVLLLAKAFKKDDDSEDDDEDDDIIENDEE